VGGPGTLYLSQTHCGSGDHRFLLCREDWEITFEESLSSLQTPPRILRPRDVLHLERISNTTNISRRLVSLPSKLPPLSSPRCRLESFRTRTRSRVAFITSLQPTSLTTARVSNLLLKSAGPGQSLFQSKFPTHQTIARQTKIVTLKSVPPGCHRVCPFLPTPTTSVEAAEIVLYLTENSIPKRGCWRP